jgi:AbrB family looped-hinge helix DNA binding protein
MGGDTPNRHSRPRQASAKARLRQKAQLTLPEEIRRALRVSEGDEVEFSVLADGTITVRGYVSVPADQLWLYAPHQDGRHAGNDVAGQGTVHGSADAMFTHLDAMGAADA